MKYPIPIQPLHKKNVAVQEAVFAFSNIETIDLKSTDKNY